MGVPGFAKWLSNKKKLSKTFIKDLTKNINALYLDANCLFHPQCFKTLKDANTKDINKLEKKMFERIIEYIDFLINEVKPTEYVYIAVDGVAPLAKMNQQRKRRFKGVIDKEKENNIKQKYNKEISEWSNIVITPGTEFMEKLHKFIIKYIKSKNKNGIKYIYSSYHVFGEGEHKILNHIKKNIKNNSNIVIYGLDADLISLAMASQKKNIFLMREASQFNNKLSSNDVKEEINYMDIDKLKELFSEYIYDEINNKYEILTNKKYNYTKLTNDFIILLILLGNDFLPHFPSININQNGLDYILEAYIKGFICFCDENNFLVNFKNNKITINQKLLQYILNDLADLEDEFFIEELPKYIYKHQNKKCFVSDPYDVEIWNHNMIKDIKIEDKIKLGSDIPDMWKFRYYNEYFKCNEFYKETVNNASYKYIEGIIWIARYYFEECPSPIWQYPYTHTPFISDVADYLADSKININDIKFKQEEPLTPCQQLLAVIPPVYYNILPINYKKLATSYESPIIKYFPLNYDIDYVNKFILHEAIPMIMNVNPNDIKNATYNVKLNKDEKIRNKYSDVLEFE